MKASIYEIAGASGPVWSGPVAWPVQVNIGRGTAFKIDAVKLNTDLDL